MELTKSLAKVAIMAVAIPLMAVAVGPVAGSAQQVRAITNGTEIRLDPTDSSPVIATMDAGATLDWIGESGPYHIVSVPGQPGEEDMIGYVLATEVEVVGSLSAEPSTVRTAIPGIREQYQRQRRRRSRGLSQVVAGAAIMAGANATVAIVFEVTEERAYEDSESYQSALDRQSTAETAKDYATIAGGALIALGASQYLLGWRKMESMEADMPQLGDPSLDEQYVQANRRRGSGQTKFFSGAALAAGSWAALKWVPWVAEPVPEDYEKEWEYLSAVHRRDRAETANKWITGLGGVLGAWGAVDWALGSMKMSEIEAISRVAALPTSVLPADAWVAPDLFVKRASGRTEIGLNWAW